MEKFLLNKNVYHYNHGIGKITQIQNSDATIQFIDGEKCLDLLVVLKSGMLVFEDKSIDKCQLFEWLQKQKKPIEKIFNEMQLNEIVQAYLNDFEKKKDFPFVVKDSIPIVWFGDLKAYFTSKKRIITIGLNPSDKEFSVVRFKEGNSIEKKLNEYFKFNPYRNWFQSFESVLNILNATYGGKMTLGEYQNFAVHIDVYSAIATQPTFGKLQDYEKQLLKNNLFAGLLKFLNPEIILFSANKAVQLEFFSDFKLYKDIPYSGKENVLTIYKAGNKILISGRNMKGTPFGGMTRTFIQEKLNECRELFYDS